jgi:type I restriction enzyme R subunit
MISSMLAYQNRTLEAAEVILQLIDMAQQMRDAPKRGDEVLSHIAHDLVEAIRQSVTIDWTQKEAVRARMRAKVKRLLRKHGYPPDKREDAVVTVIEQAETVCREWGEAA